MNGYQLSRRYWDWVFRNPGATSPAHAALYAWFLEACNRAEWPDIFEMAPQYAMSAIGVRSYNTYKDTLSDLQIWGFVRIRQKGANQYAPWLIALSNFDEPLNKAFDEARDEATGFALSNFDIPLNKARNKACNNPRDAYTINQKPETLNLKTVLSPAHETEPLEAEKPPAEQTPPPTPAPPPPEPDPLTSYGSQLAADRQWWENARMSLKVSDPDLTGHLTRFIAEQRAIGKGHRDYADFKGHAFNWIRIQVEKQTNHVKPTRNAANFLARQQAAEPPKGITDYGKF